MNAPVKPTLKPYTSQLPDMNNPATWPSLNVDYWTWNTGDGYTNLSTTVTYCDAAMAHIDTALAGSASIVDSVAALVSGATAAGNADKLDGQHGAFYRNASNLASGVVPAARLSGNYDITAADAGMLGGAPAASYLRSDQPGQVILDDLISRNQGIIRSGTAYLEAGQLVWENGVNRITNNDGGGHVQMRLGHKYDGGDKFTHNGTAFYVGGASEAHDGGLDLKVAANGGAGAGQPVVWGEALSIYKDRMTFGGRRVLRSNQVQTWYGAPKVFASAQNVVLSDLSCTITPTSPGARVLIMVNLTCEASWDGMLYLMRGGVEIGSPAPAGNRTRGIAAIPHDGNEASTMTSPTIIYVDHPSTTNPVTYAVGARFASPRPFYLNRTANDVDGDGYHERGSSRVICMEI